MDSMQINQYIAEKLFGIGTQGDGVLDIGCNMFTLNILAQRQRLLQRYIRPLLRGPHHDLMITYKVFS
jgi:hypothetical protein